MIVNEEGGGYPQFQNTEEQIYVYPMTNSAQNSPSNWVKYQNFTFFLQLLFQIEIGENLNDSK